MTFIYGLAAGLFIAYLAYLFIQLGVKMAVKDNELTVAVYNEKTDTWKISRSFDTVVDRVRFRQMYAPNKVKFLD